MEEETKRESAFDILKKNWWIIFFVIVFFGFKGKWGNVIYDKAQFYPVVGIILISLSKMFWEWGKYKSPQILWYKGNASINYKDIIKIGKWRLTRLGGIDYSGLSFSGFEGILIAPDGYWHKNGDGWNVRTRVILVELEILPDNIRQYIINYKLPTKKILLGYYPVEMEITNKDLLNLEQLNQELNRQNNQLREILKGNKRVIEQEVGYAKRISKDKKTFWDRFKSSKEENE